MANKFPLVANSDQSRIEELAANDNLDLTSNGVSINGNTGIVGQALVRSTDGTVAWGYVGNVVASGTQVFSNKTINCANNNTLLNIPNSALLNSSIQINGTNVPLGNSIVISTASGVEELTNKTIDGTKNTLTNIQNSSLQNSQVTINGSTVSLGGTLTIPGTTGDVTLSGVQIITNKVIDGNNNTLQNINTTSLTASGITLNGNKLYLGGSYTTPIPDVTASGAVTLTNKTIDGTANTLSNIANSSLVNSSITVNGSGIPLGGSVNVGNVTISGSQVLINKTIDATQNTLSNIPTTALTASGITINGTNTFLGNSITVNTLINYGGNAPTNTTSSGVAGTFVYADIGTANASLYVCLANNFWQRYVADTSFDLKTNILVSVSGVKLTSTAFNDGDFNNSLVPAYTGTSYNEPSPQLTWSGNTAAVSGITKWHLFAVEVTSDTIKPFIFWSVLNIPKATTSVAAGATVSGGTIFQNNYYNLYGTNGTTNGWGAPMPASRTGVHTYEFQIFGSNTTYSGSTAINSRNAYEDLLSNALVAGKLRVYFRA